MEKELNYLSEKIDELGGQIDTLEANHENYTTNIEIGFYVSNLDSMREEKEVLENMLNYISINELTKPV